VRVCAHGQHVAAVALGVVAIAQHLRVAAHQPVQALQQLVAYALGRVARAGQLGAGLVSNFAVAIDGVLERGLQHVERGVAVQRA
jgi:hypothetical protein